MKKILKISGITVGFLVLILVLMLLFPFIFREKFASIVRNTARKSLTTEMNFSDMDVSFFYHFPRLTLSLKDFYLLSPQAFKGDTLIKARDISFGVNLMSVFRGPLRISRVYINNGIVHLKYNENGRGNYDVVKSSSDTTAASDTSGSANLKIESISFVNTDFVYSDPSVPMSIICHGINYKGESEITNDILSLHSNLKIDSLDFIYDKTEYLKSKPVKADLSTTINLNSLDITLNKNDLMIKDVPFEFHGDMNFRNDGYSFFISLYSMYQDEWISGSFYLVSTDKIWISAKTDINLNLEQWAKRLGVRDYDLKGLFVLKLNAQGNYITGPDPENPKDTGIQSIPDFTLSSALNNGYFKFAALPAGLEGINFNLKAASNGHDYRKTNLEITDLRATFLKNKIEGYLKVNGIEDFPVESEIKSDINLAELKKVFPIDSLDLAGILHLDLKVNGKYAPEKKLFPEATINTTLKDGYLLTKYYPEPLQNINLNAEITNSTGTVAGTNVKVNELSFSFKQNPFNVSGYLSNPDNLKYDIRSKGTLDLAGIYKMFTPEGMQLAGMIKTDLHLKGTQADAMAGRIERLDNIGILELYNIAFRSEYLPDELILRTGRFRFDNDKIWFEKFVSKTGKSDIVLDGNLSNVVNYALGEKQVLHGSFTFRSEYTDVNDFMAPAAPSAPATSSAPAKEAQSQPSQSAGVVMVPDDLDLQLKADLKKVKFEGNIINNLNGEIDVKPGEVELKDLSLEMIGCKVAMEADYKSVNPKKAAFSFHVKADDFDVQRAYREVELFRNLASSAEKCEGIISLDYNLKGKLKDDMEPVYPSIEGGGVLTVKKVKVMGLKMFSAMSSNLGKEKLKDPDLSKVEFKTHIKNNIITLEQTKIKISGFRLKISGETSFDGKLNLKTRVGLPPLGIVGIPIKILGTSDNPKFRYGRGNNDEALEETEYSDEIPAEFLDKLRNTKEEDDDNGQQ